MTTTAALPRALLLLVLVHAVLSFTLTYSSHPVRLWKCQVYSSSSNDDEEEMEKKMAFVRALQSAYYMDSDDSTGPTLEKSTGILRNLSLWRVQWTELPGRSNVLNVHEPTYTNMFEKILRGPKPWYVGHLYLPGGSKNLKSEKRCFQLKTWKEEVDDELREVHRERTAVVGTVLRITDFRRLSDGRLILLVQAMERFVVVNSVQTVPYSIADVQIVPDYDDIPTATEVEARVQRAQAVLESFAYHDYEYDVDFALPCPDNKYISVLDIFGPDIARVLPFVPYSKTIDPTKLDPVECAEATEDAFVEEPELSSLEARLVEGDILHSGTKTETTVDTLEDQLWTALADFTQATGIVIPPAVLCLLPPNRDWPHPVERLPPEYPSDRRQRRLSFAASVFLEGSNNVGADFRQAWLETAGTKARLSVVLDQFKTINGRLLGEFQ